MRLTRWFFLLSFFVAAPAAAAPECDHEVPVDVTEADGTELGWAPGDTVCVLAGARPFLRFYNVVGTEAAPILITNAGGVVELANADRGYGLTFDGSSFFQLTGTGSDDTYGFSVSATRTGPDYSASCVTVASLSTDYELDHLEIFGCGFAGMNLKTEPTCDGSANLGSFVQRNSRVHHNFIHDTGGEGIYFGSTGYGGREYQCDGQTTLLQPHTHEGVWIHDNLIQDTGWDGMQVGVSPKDCFVYRNTIQRVGLAMEQYQMQGIQIGGASACDVTENVLIQGPAAGIFVLDPADMHIHNNTIVGFLDGIYENDNDNAESEGVSVVIAHNTIVNTTDRAISMFGARTVANGVVNNLIVATTGTPLSIGGDVDVTESGNLVLASVDEALFVDAEQRDYQLQASSPAVDAGVVSAEFAVEKDQRGAVRDEQPDVGALEYGVEPDPGETEPPPSSGGSGPDGSSGTSGSNGSSGSSNSSSGSGGALSSGETGDDSGCGCRTQGSAGASSSSLLLFALALLARRRRSEVRRPRLG